VSPPNRKVPPIAAAVLRSKVAGTKRRRVLALIALFLDAGADPTIAELSKRSGFDIRTVMALIEGLEADGVLVVDRRGSGYPDNRPATYRIDLPGVPPPKEKRMTAATTTPVLPMTPPGFESGWLKPLVSIDWPVYELARQSHEQAVAELAAAACDRPAEIEALRAVAELVEQAARVLPPEVDEGGAGYLALEKKREELQPPPASDQHPLAQGMSMAEARQNADTVAAIRGLDGADKRQLMLDFRADFYWLNEVSWHGSGSKLSTAAGYVGEVRRRCSEAAAE
jgi:hypothetical protein